jgi:hypothetical protein
MRSLPTRSYDEPPTPKRVGRAAAVPALGRSGSCL